MRSASTAPVATPDAAATAPPEQLATSAADAAGTDELTGLLDEVARLGDRLAELRLRLMRAVEQTEIAADDGVTGTDAWLARLTGSTRSAASGGWWLARMLQERYPAVQAAFAAGDLGREQARVIVRAAEKLPDGVSDDERDQVAHIVERAVAQRLDPARLRGVVRRMCDRISRQLADRHEAKIGAAEEKHAEQETWLRLEPKGDGTYEGRFVVPELHGQMRAAVLQHLCSPRRLRRNRAGDAVVDGSAPANLG